MHVNSGTLTRFTSGPPEFPYCRGRKHSVSGALSPYPSAPEAVSPAVVLTARRRGRVLPPAAWEGLFAIHVTDELVGAV